MPGPIAAALVGLRRPIMKLTARLLLFNLLLSAPASAQTREPGKPAQAPTAASPPSRPRLQLGVFEDTLIERRQKGGATQ
jgi:hypothetical protein